jgi:hypothetical protein
MPVMLDETLSVITAAVDCPGDSVVPPLFQVMLIGPSALIGLQFPVVMLSASVTPVPVFLT